MTKLTTTLALIKKHKPCEDGLETLLNYLDEDYPEDKEINLLTILESNGIDHFFWAFRAVKQDGDIANRLALQIAVAFSERVLHIYEDKYTEDYRPRKAIESVMAYLNASTKDERKEAAEAVWAAAAAAEEAAEEALESREAARVALEARVAGAAAAAARAAAAKAAVAACAAAWAREAVMAAREAVWEAGEEREAREEEYNAQTLIIKSLLAD